MLEEMPPARALNNYLRMYRKRAGLTQAELALLLGCAHRSKVSRYERGARSPSIATVIGLEVVFRAPIAALYAGLYAKVREEVRARARKLSRRIDAGPKTPLSKQKFDALVDVVFPPKADKA